jgi:hypothetical protein
MKFSRLILLSGASTLCALSASAAINLDFTNYSAGTQPDTEITAGAYNGLGQNGMLFTDVADFATTTYAIDAVLESLDTYAANNTNNNSAFGDDIRINQLGSTTTTYRLNLFDAGTTDLFDPGVPFTYDLNIYDIDNGNAGATPTLETFKILTAATYTLTNTTSITVVGGNTFYNGTDGLVANVSAGATDLTDAQENASVILTLSTSSLDFQVTTGGNGGRNLFFDADDLKFDQPSTTTSIVVPEPSTYAAIVGALSLLAVVSLRRRNK